MDNNPNDPFSLCTTKVKRQLGTHRMKRLPLTYSKFRPLKKSRFSQLLGCTFQFDYTRVTKALSLMNDWILLLMMNPERHKRFQIDEA